MSDHFIWNLLNESLAILINFMWNDHKCKILFINDPLNPVLSPPKFISMKICIVVTKVFMLLLVPTKCYVTCGDNIIYDMTLSTEKQ